MYIQTHSFTWQQHCFVILWRMSVLQTYQSPLTRKCTFTLRMRTGFFPPKFSHGRGSAVWPSSSVTAVLLTLVIVLHWAAKLHGCLGKACKWHGKHSLPLPLKCKCTHSVTRSETRRVNQWPGHCRFVDSDWLPDWLDTLTLSLICKSKPEN